MTRQPAVWFILTTILIDAIGIGLIWPMMPDLMARVGAGTSGTGAVWSGVLMAAYALTQFLFAPLVGGLSDALGRKPVLLVAMGTLAVDYVVMAVAPTFALLLAARLVAGIAGATHVTATAYLADISSPEKKAANFGLIGAGFGVGFVLGPALGGLLAEIDVTAPFWAAAGLAALNVGFGLFILPESLAPEKRRPLGQIDWNPFAAIIAAFRVPGVGLPLAAVSIFEFANMVYPTLWAFWGREMFGWSAGVIGLSLAVYGVLIALVQGVLLPRLIRWVGEYRLTILALLLGVVGAVGFGFSTAVWMVAVLMPIAALSDMAPPTMTALLSNATDEERQGVLQGVIASLASVAAIVAPLTMAPLFRVFTEEGAKVYFPGAPYMMSAGLMVVALGLMIRLKRRER